MKSIMLFSLLICSKLLSAQLAEVNLVIAINENIATNEIQNPIFLFFVKDNQKIDSVKAYYSPGALKIDSSSYKKINTLVYTKTSLSFEYQTALVDGLISKRNYEIVLYSDWVKANYIIINFYDLSKKKYKKIFSAKTKYVYEITSDLISSSAIRRE